MHPAPSVIVFTVLSGLGFGFLGVLSLGAVPATGWTAFWLWGLGAGLATAGLVASTFHLGHPARALRAFTQWRTSWLSREAWASTLTLLLVAPVGLMALFGTVAPRALAWPAAAGCALTVVCTAMIYTQITAVPRWNFWTTPVLFAGFALTGGLILTASAAAPVSCIALGLLMIVTFHLGDGRFAARGSTLGSATGLAAVGTPSVFEQPHTGGNYLMREMIHVVGRKHARRLRVIAVVCAALIPGAITALSLGLTGVAVATAVHLTGAFAARWLFFAEAEHVVGLYYGQRQSMS